MKKFLKHIFPKYILKNNLNILYTFCFGGFALTTFLIMLFSGVLLALYYIPTIDNAYESIINLERHVFAGSYIRNLHYLSSICYFSMLFLHTLRVILTSAFTRGYNFIVGIIILFISLFAGYTGYILPMDQKGYWAGITGIELINILPLGEEITKLIFPDNLMGNLSLIRIYLIHILIVPFSILFLISLHFYKIRKDKGVLPFL